MPSLNFHKRFAADVEAGRKRQTIRLRRKRPWKIGDRLYLFTGMRTKHCRRLGEATCRDLLEMRRVSRGDWRMPNAPCRLGGGRLSFQFMTALAMADGFDSLAEFEDWFDQYNDGAWLDVIRW